MDFTKIDLEKELKKLKNLDDCLFLNKVVLIDVINALNGSVDDLIIIDVEDFSYEANFGKYCIGGSALYGTCHIALTDG